MKRMLWQFSTYTLIIDQELYGVQEGKEDIMEIVHKGIECHRELNRL